MLHISKVLSLIVVTGGVLVGCMSMPAPPTVGLQRSLYPGLGDLKPEQIADAFSTTVVLTPPISAGLAWLSEAPPQGQYGASAISEYHRTGVLEAALAALRQPPFASVASLPTVPEVTNAAPGPGTLDALRSAAARFQYDVVFLLQTGVAEDRGLNILALGYLGLVTVPLIPGDDLGVASSAELCAIDVRTGVMLGCARGRGQSRDRFVFRRNTESSRQELAERTLRTSVQSAAADLLDQMSMRVKK